MPDAGAATLAAIDETRRRRRVLAVVVALLLIPVPLVVASTTYRGSSDAHSAIEVVGAVIGLAVGTTFVLRYTVLRDRLHLFFGMAFIAGASADLAHGLIPFLAARGLIGFPQAAMERFVPGSFLAGRTLAALTLVLAPVLAGRLARAPGRKTVVSLGLVVTALGAAVTLLLFTTPLPPLLFPSHLVPRPADLVAGAMFAVATVVLATYHRRTGDLVAWWVAISASVAGVSQLTIAFSAELYDAAFDAAHLYKVIAYAVPLIAVSFHQVRLLARLAAINTELREADRLKTEFVSVVSHELRTPMTSILGFASLLTEYWDVTPEEEKRSHIRVIERQGERLSRLINDLLAVSRLESGALETNLQTLDLGTVVARALDSLDSGSQVKVDIAEGTVVRADPDQLEQILVNYLANAMKYGAPPVIVSSSNSGGYVDVVVADHGDGVPETFRDRLFEKFAQADAGPTRRSSGTGLGLSIVRGLARAQGGDAWYEPNDPSGSRFAVRLEAGS